MKPRKLSYPDRLKIQFMDYSMYGIFLKWLAKINKKKDLEGIDKTKQEKHDSQRAETLTDDIQDKP